MPNILNDICHISFSGLLQITLGLIDPTQGPICSIEALAYLDAENLKFLEIRSVQLTQIKALGKTRWRNLDTLVMNGKNINEVDVSSRVMFKKEKNINEVDVSRGMFTKEGRVRFFAPQAKMVSMAKLQPESSGTFLWDE
jgi:hypothetical protein